MKSLSHRNNYIIKYESKNFLTSTEHTLYIKISPLHFPFRMCGKIGGNEQQVAPASAQIFLAHSPERLQARTRAISLLSVLSHTFGRVRKISKNCGNERQSLSCFRMSFFGFFRTLFSMFPTQNSMFIIK